MGFSNWLARKGNVGGTARAVAKGWKKIKKEYPNMEPSDIAKTYVKLRYSVLKNEELETNSLLKNLIF